MRNLKAILAVCTLCFFMTQCNRSSVNVEGKWMMQKVDLMGTIVDSATLENSYYLFKDNKYSSEVMSNKDEGTYRIVADSLFLKSNIIKGKPETQYVIENADSVSLVLSSDKNGNIIRVNLTREVLQ